MERSLRLRTLILAAITLFCLATLAPSFVEKDSLPSWFKTVFSKQISLGLDLQGGKHVVYNIALDRAIDDKASEVKRDLDARCGDEKLDVTVRLPSQLGAVSLQVKDPAQRDKASKDVHDTTDSVAEETCPEGEPKDAICFVVSSSYADTIKNAALLNAVATIRERINEKGVAEPSVVTKGDDIIVELPGDPNSDAVKDTEALIARTAKLEMKVV